MGCVDTFKLKGQVLDARYRVEEVVGEGNFGVVYRATQLNFDETVAIKVLKVPAQISEADADTFVQTFRSEGKHLRKLSAEHPAFVRAHDAGVLQFKGKPAPYLVLEWLDGEPLERDLVLRREKGAHGRSVEEGLTILEPIFGALMHAHCRLVAHRDIKPANIFLAQTALGTISKLLDFGMAKVMTTNDTVGLHAPTLGGLAGLTPAYAAPEQWDRQLGATGPWSDVYSLALVFVELLTDKPPLDGDDVVSYIAATFDDNRPTPNARGASIPAEVEAVFLKALAVQPQDRYRNAGIFWNALLEALETNGNTSNARPFAKLANPTVELLEQPPDFQRPAERGPSDRGLDGVTRPQEEVATIVEGKKVPRSDAQNPGDRIADRYCIERSLGSGGMGDVYLARDELHGRHVALKLLRRHVADNLVVVNRFRREARITAQLSNSHAVKVYDFGQAHDGSLYLSMEFLEGEPMNRLLEREEHLSPQRAVDIALDLLEVLAEAHGYGIIHRDIKPANVFLVARPDGPPIVKLLDFGIAKLGNGEATELTASGDIWGTPRYMSPEQAGGKQVDQRSDLYSLGVLLYKALTGTFPYEASNAAELAFALLNDVKESPDKRRPDLQIPPELGRVVLRALAREPEARYSSASEMAADLRAIADATPRGESPQMGRVAWAIRALALAPLVFVFLCMLELPGALRRPFPGFAIESGLLVSAVMDSSWPGATQDIQMYDIVLAVDGHPVQHGRDIQKYLADKPEGTLVEYTLQRETQIMRKRVPVSRLSFFVLFKQYVSASIAGLLFAIVCAVVAWRRPFSRDAHALLAFGGLTACVLAGAVDLDLVHVLTPVWRFALSLSGSGMIHLALTYPNRWDPLHRNAWRIWALYVPGLLVFLYWQGFAHQASIALQGTRIASLIFALGALVLFGRLVYTRFRGATLPMRQSARVLLWGVSVAIVPSIIITVSIGVGLAWLNDVVWLSVLALSFFPMLVGYQLVRGELFDVDVALSSIVRGSWKLALFLLAFVVPAAGMVAVCRTFEIDLIPQMVLGALAGITVTTIASEKLEELWRWIVNRRSDADSAAALEQFAAATQKAESKAEVLDALKDMLQRVFSPNTLHLFEHDQDDQYRDLLDDSQGGRSDPSTHRAHGRRTIAPEDMPKPGDSIQDIRRRLTQLGHWDAHAYLVLPFASAYDGASPNSAPTSILVLGTRADGRPYSSFHSALIAGFIRVAVLRIQTMEERARAKQGMLQERCLGPDRTSKTSAMADAVLDAPARGLAATLLLRFSALDKASEGLSPRQFKEMMNKLYETASMIALDRGGTLHSIRGDEMLFGFGALGIERPSADLDAIATALDQVERLQTIIHQYHATSVHVRCGLSRGVVTVGIFGASFRQDCLLIGTAIREAMTLVDHARDGEVVVDDELAKLVTDVKAPYLIHHRPDLSGGCGVIQRLSE